MDLLQVFIEGYKGYAQYLWKEITNPSWHNYFYALTTISVLFFILELLKPWRKRQPIFRRDFWLDVGYMYFNFFIFSLIIYKAGSDVFVVLTRDIVSEIFNVDLATFNPLHTLPLWLILIIGFVLRDFIQWWTHRLLHRSKWLWQFHKVHHSVKQMGFAAHLRYHWMETIVYRTIEYLPLALIGYGLTDFFIIHIVSIIIGHYNHSNLQISHRIIAGALLAFVGILIGSNGLEISLVQDPTLATALISGIIGFLVGYFIFGKAYKFVFNSPEMHIWHHAKHLPSDKVYGVNFGLSLSIWDYLFKTAYIPHDGRDIELGFPEDTYFPSTFLKQVLYGFLSKK